MHVSFAVKVLLGVTVISPRSVTDVLSTPDVVQVHLPITTIFERSGRGVISE